MGRKGVSKRKPSQTKTKPFTNDKSGGSISSVMSATENQAGKSAETGKGSYSTDQRKTPKKS